MNNTKNKDRQVNIIKFADYDNGQSECRYAFIHQEVEQQQQRGKKTKQNGRNKYAAQTLFATSVPLKKALILSIAFSYAVMSFGIGNLCIRCWETETEG